MIRTKSLLVALLCGAARLSAQQPAAPPEVRAEWRSLIGDYVAGDSVIYIAEVNGALKLRPGLFTSINLPDPRVQLSPHELVYTGRRYARRDAAQGTFRITPVRPVQALRAEALAARPPAQPDTLLAADLVELRSLEPTIRYDIRYATTNNFMSSVFYSQARAFLQRPAAEALVRAHHKLSELGYGLLIHDAYRPWYVTKMFWDATPQEFKDFVADPSRGSRHNRGAAVDLTLYRLDSGEPVEMVGGYDEFSNRSYPDYPGGTALQRWHRELLRVAMEAEGFTVYDVEWWHFDYDDWRRYRIGNVTFDRLR